LEKIETETPAIFPFSIKGKKEGLFHPQGRERGKANRIGRQDTSGGGGGNRKQNPKDTNLVGCGGTNSGSGKEGSTLTRFRGGKNDC